MRTDATADQLPPTEQRNPASTELDTMSSRDILGLLNREDSTVATAVAAVLDQVAELADHGVSVIRSGGNIHYFGAGTSGRLAVLDAAELLPTFNLAPGRVIAHIAGGDAALRQAIEGSEDSTDAGTAAAAEVSSRDLVLGVAASGNTPYVRAALRESQLRGARTALLCSNPAASRENVDDFVAVDTGPEVLTGSTRLKAGTATKLLLNSFSTTVMIKSGHVWSNLMINVVASNAKLRARSVRILSGAADLPATEAEAALAAADGDLKVGLLVALTEADHDAARRALDEHGGTVRDAIAALIGPRNNGHRSGDVRDTGERKKL